MKSSIVVDNLKCGGCGRTIFKKINSLENTSNVEVDIEKSKITFEYSKEETPELVEKTLSNLGYPKKGTTNITQKVKSYASCAIGKIDNKINN